MTRMTSIRNQQQLSHKASENGTEISRPILELGYSFATPYDGPPIDYPLPKASLAIPVIPKAQIYDPGKHAKNHQVQEQQQQQQITASQPPSRHRTPASSKVADNNRYRVDQAGLDSPGQSPPNFVVRGSPSPSSSSPFSESSPMVGEVKEVAPRVPQRSPASEIEELVPSPSPSAFSPSVHFLRRTPSFEGNVTDSSALQYSEEFSAPESGEFTEPSPVVVNGGGPYGLDTSTSSRNNQKRKKGRCYKCLKGNRLTEKEVCLVCESKYCGNCVLQAMGSMPEGRKCEECVGSPILESRRPFLGKPSRLLRRLIRDPLEIQQCMKSEKECAANQLQPDQVFVNGKRLVTEEMELLLAHTKLKPGKYWYDKQSGLWGKEGEKPYQVIPANLKVGGTLKSDASNGSTNVFVNNRQITKSELNAFKIFGVQCTPSTYLFLNSDGDYGEEINMKEPKGNLWNKPTTKLLHPFVSFPTPRSSSQDMSQPSSSLKRTQTFLEAVHKILLIGHDGSGRSTIFKQAKIIENGHFSAEELRRYKGMILDKAYQFLCVLLEARERFEEEDMLKDTGMRTRSIYALHEQLKNVADSFLERMSNSGLERTDALNREFSLARIWNETAIQATLKRKDELHMLPDVASELLNRVLQGGEYVPSQEDILLAEGLEQGTGLAELMFTIDDRGSDSSEQDASLCRYQLISIGGLSTNESRKWLGMFEDVQILVFCVAISDYDQWWTDPFGTVHNKLVFSRDLFVKIVKYPCFQETPLVLLLNKFDKFEEKIVRGVPLTKCQWFSDYSPVGSSHSGQVQQAYMYIVHKYKRLLEGRRIYTLQLNAQDREMVSQALDYVQQVLKCEEEKKVWSMQQDESMYGDTTLFPVQNHSNDDARFQV